MILRIILSVSVAYLCAGLASSNIVMGSEPRLNLTGAYRGLPCRLGSPYYSARQNGKDAYADRHNGDLLEVLVENRPELIDLYGKCVEELNLLDSLSALFNPSIYINLISLQALKELIYRRVVDAVCQEIQVKAEEVYGVIADIIPLGEYVYDLDDVFGLQATATAYPSNDRRYD